VIIAFVNQKGGVGKSTAALHYVAWCHSMGCRTRLVDADAQGSSSGWCRDLPEDIPHESIARAEQLIDRLSELRDEGAERVVVDAPAGLAEETRAILFLADLAIIPIQPSGLDLRSSSEAFRIVRQARKVRQGAPIARSFLSRADPGTKLAAEAVAALDQVEDIPRLAAIVHQRTAIADASVQRCTIADRRPRDPRAEQEMQALCREIDQIVASFKRDV